MECYHPIRIPNARFFKAHEFLKYVENRGVYGYESFSRDLISQSGITVNYSKTFDKHYDFHTKVEQYESPYMYVPCRKCPACIRRRASEWSGRLAREIKSNIDKGKHCAFVTFTYSDEYIAHARSNYKHDVAVLFDRFRSKLRNNIRHFVISELGEKRGRFHLHAILFDVPKDKFEPVAHIRKNKYGHVFGSNPFLDERWRYGIVDTSLIKSVGAGVYVAGYLNKNKPHKDGQYYVSPIIASNGIGYKDVTQMEISNISSSIACNIMPYFEVGGKRYQYPQSMINKYLSLDDKLKLSALSAGRNESLGGQFKVGTNYLRNFSEFCEQIKSYKSPIIHYRLKNENPTIGIKENTDFLNESSYLFKGSEVINVTYPQMVAESIIYKYRNIMSNYTPF